MRQIYRGTNGRMRENYRVPGIRLNEWMIGGIIETDNSQGAYAAAMKFTVAPTLRARKSAITWRGTGDSLSHATPRPGEISILSSPKPRAIKRSPFNCRGVTDAHGMRINWLALAAYEWHILQSKLLRTVKIITTRARGPSHLTPLMTIITPRDCQVFRALYDIVLKWCNVLKRQY